MPCINWLYSAIKENKFATTVEQTVSLFPPTLRPADDENRLTVCFTISPHGTRRSRSTHFKKLCNRVRQLCRKRRVHLRAGFALQARRRFFCKFRHRRDWILKPDDKRQLPVCKIYVWQTNRRLSGKKLRFDSAKPRHPLNIPPMFPVCRDYAKFRQV